jgi:hypothetical protein
MRRAAVMDVGHVVAWMNAQQLLHLRQRRIVELEIDVETGCYQSVADGPEPVRAFRVMCSHVVLPAVAMGDEGGGCHIECFA